MFQRKSEVGEEQGETVIALYSQQTNMSYIPPVYLKNGPNQNRSCTNLCCCLLFLLSIGALGYFYFLTYSSQHIERLYTPVDSEGRECGQGNLNKFPLIYFVTPEEKYLYRTVCVEKCPKKEDKLLLCAPNKLINDCHNNPSPSDPEKRVLVYESDSYSGNICLPTDDNLKKAVQPAILVGEIQQALINTKANLPIIAISGGAAFLLAFFFTIMIGLCTTLIVYVFILVYISLTGFLSTYFLLYFIRSPLDLFPYFDKSIYAWSPYMLAASITFAVLCVYAIFTLCWNLRKMKFMIHLGISLVKLATTFLYQNKTIIIVPIVFFFLVMSTLLIWIASALAVLSEQQMDYSLDSQIYPFEKIQLKFDTLIKLMITVLALIWLMQYILSLARFLNASTATLWYGFLYDSFKLAVRYHNGSITAEAIYSFFFSGIAKAFNLIYESLNRCRLKRHNFILNCFASISLCLCCVFKEQYLFYVYINNYAFVYIVMTSADYFESSKAVHFVIKRNHSDFETLSGLGEQFTHFSKMFIFLITTIGTFIYVKEQTDFVLQLYTFAIIAFITLSIATLFMDMFGQSADALLLAYFTDCEVYKSIINTDFNIYMVVQGNYFSGLTRKILLWYTHVLYHFGLEECGSCPQEIKDQVQHIREKQKIYYG